jgi:Glycosyl transferase family 2
VSVAAVVIWTPGDPDPGPCLDSLAPQVDELVLTVNPGGSPATREAEVIANERTLGFGANINRGVAATTAPYVVVSNSDIEVTPGAVAELTRFVEAHPRCGIGAPQLQYPDGRWQPSRRSFPTIRGTLVRRTPLRRLLHPEQRQRDHYLLDEQPSEPAPSDWFLGAFLLLRREMLSSAASTRATTSTARTSTSPIAPERPAGNAGTCRARWSYITTRRSPTAASSRGARSGTGEASPASCASTPRVSAPFRLSILRWTGEIDMSC